MSAESIRPESGKWFWRSGLLFSVTDDNTALINYSGTFLAAPIAGQAGSLGLAMSQPRLRLV
jgi:hypothetical protein